MITLDDMRKGLREGYDIDFEEVFYVPAFITSDGLSFSFQDAESDEQMAWMMNPHTVIEFKGRIKTFIPPILDFYDNHGNGD